MIIIMDLKSILSVTVLFVMQVNGLLPAPRQLADKCDLTARPQCSSDCTKILACVSLVETPMLSVNCTGKTPFCDNGRCVSTPGKCTKRAQEATFLCTSAGVFPDPTDCRKSHFCAEVGSQSVMSLCPRGHIFDSKTKVCGLKTSNSQSICKKVRCNGVTNDFVTFMANPTFYAYCFTSATGVQHTYMYKCDDEINKVFDVISKKCRFNCTSVGYHADPMDCSSYYICNGLQFASRRVHCPPNYYFNGTVCLNSKAHCPAGSIVSSNAKPTSTADNLMADGMFTTAKPTSLSDSSLVDALTSTPLPTSITDSSVPFELTSRITTVSDSSLTYELTSTPTLVSHSSMADELTSTPVSDSASADELTSTPTLVSHSSMADELTSTPVSDSSSADELTSTQISDSSLAGEMSAINEPIPTVEVATDTTVMPFSESSTTETSITHKPATVENFQTNLTTKKPSIWKHMGLISVRVSRLLNIV